VLNRAQHQLRTGLFSHYGCASSCLVWGSWTENRFLIQP